jgi:2-keto-4-pentenoate hydratase/2-oxohepta-3-ene-1,7-dioic acid hydratase in catechol pathway
MRISRVLVDNEPALVADTRDGGRRVVKASSDLCELLPEDGRAPSEWELGQSVSDGHVLAPLRPPKIVAIGLNYHDHASESGVTPPERPLVFAKFPSSVIGTDDPIEIDPSVAERVDWEVELAVVIGRRMKGVGAAHALDYVFGYTVANDVSARDVQFGDGQWTRGKSFDTFCPLGPVIVTPDELGSPDDLRLWTTVNGETMQSDTTANLIFAVPELLSFCSNSFTLEPGDVILTGTPPGCGEFMTPPRSLADGDVVETGVDGIGRLRNPVVFTS